MDKHFVESKDDVPSSMFKTHPRLDFDSHTIRGDEAGDQPRSISIQLAAVPDDRLAPGLRLFGVHST